MQDIILQDFIVFFELWVGFVAFSIAEKWYSKKIRINSFYLRTKLECDSNITDIGQITDFALVYGIELNSPLHKSKKLHEKNVFPTDLGNQSFEVAANHILNWLLWFLISLTQIYTH